MTVRELINWLEEFNDDAEVVIGMQQRYGSDFAVEIDDVSGEKVNLWDGDEDNNGTSYVVLTEGRQIGSVSYRKEW